MKRGLLYLQLKKNEEALEDFSKLSSLAEEAH
jgi:regulator of sirC expression with transglutaminase-like and TPR domain